MTAAVAAAAVEAAARRRSTRLELQMEILRSTMALPDDAPGKRAGGPRARPAAERGVYRHDWSGRRTAAGLVELGTALHKARVSMESAARLLDTQPPVKAVPDEEAALGSLIEAAKLLEDAKAELPPAGETERGDELYPAPSPGAEFLPEATTQEDADEEREALRELMEEVRRQLAEQQALNQGSGEDGERADQQQSLAQDARSAASQARGIPASSGRRGDPRAAAEELERAAGLQDDNAEALAGGDAEASAQLGARERRSPGRGPAGTRGPTGNRSL